MIKFDLKIREWSRLRIGVLLSICLITVFTGVYALVYEVILLGWWLDGHFNFFEAIEDALIILTFGYFAFYLLGVSARKKNEDIEPS